MDTVTALTHEALLAMDQRKRAHLINSLGGFKSVCLIGSIDSQQRTNLTIFNSIVHLGAHPPLVACIIRPDTAERHTLDNILETQCYTINHLNESIYQKGHQTSARYHKTISEFDAVGLTPEFRNPFLAPFVKESQVKLGLEFRQRVNIDLNGTILIIGEIVHVSFPTPCWHTDGYLDIEKAGTIAGSGLDSYHVTHRLKRLSYAKPDLPLTEISPDYLTR